MPEHGANDPARGRGWRPGASIAAHAGSCCDGDWRI